MTVIAALTVGLLLCLGPAAHWWLGRVARRETPAPAPDTSRSGGEGEGRAFPGLNHAPRHDCGGLESVTRRFVCGCHHYDGTGRLVRAEPCQPADWDAELRRLTS